MRDVRPAHQMTPNLCKINQNCDRQKAQKTNIGSAVIKISHFANALINKALYAAANFSGLVSLLMP
jgi:hypothetical protein